MTKFQLLSCDIALAGDVLNVVARHARIPVTYPELLILRYLHGENSVTNIYDVGYAERDEADEFRRLMETYGEETVRQKMFPGAGLRLPNGDNRFKPRVMPPPAAHVPTMPPAAPAAEPPDYSAPPASNYVPPEPEPAPEPPPAPTHRAPRKAPAAAPPASADDAGL